MVVSIEELGFGLASSELAEQERALAALRTCASTVLGAAAVAGSFLGARAIHGSFRGEALLTETDHAGILEVTEAYRAIGFWIRPYAEANRKKIAGLSRWLATSCVLLTVEVVLWTISVVG